MAGSPPIDFADLAAALLQRAETLVPQWLPGGRFAGAEYVCADLCGGAGRSCSVNCRSGRWADFSSDERGNDLISLYAAVRQLGQAEAARELMAELGWQRHAAPAAPAPKINMPPAGPHEPPLEAYADDAPARGGEGAGAVDDGGAVAPPPGPGEPAAKRRSMWRPVVPVPEHAPAPDFKHWHYTDADRAGAWEYRFGPLLYGWVVRFRTSTGGKEILPLTWCVDERDNRGTQRWHWHQWAEPRPLYVPATLLSADASLAVVVVEGEKCAEAGHRALGHEFDFVSWPGGSKAWNKADWRWIAGRTVYLWPDCDAKRQRLTADDRAAGLQPGAKPLLPEAKQPGMHAMVGIGTLLAAEHGCTVHLCPVPAPGAVADGWDLADAIEQGWTAADVRAFIRGAREFVPPSASPAPADADAGGSGGGDGGDGAARNGAGAGNDHPPSKRWRTYLLRTSTNATRPVRENATLALDGLPDRDVPGIEEAAGVIGYNEFTHDVVKLKPAPWGSPAGAWDEADDLLLGEWLVRAHGLPSMPRGAIDEAVRMVAYRHRYHPVRQYLQALRWDGHARLATWLRRACLEEDEYDDEAPLQRYLARAGTYYLMGMCRRVREPGCKFDYMLVLESPQQGRGKSSLFRLLGGEWFADTGLVLGDKDSFAQLQGRWVYEMPELDALSRADVRQIKSYVASQSDYFRASYDRRARDYPRQMVFGGTTNDDHYLLDPTGNRRFWPVRVTRYVDLAWLAEQRDQLFAEALARLDAGERYYPPPAEEEELFVPQQQQRMVESAIATKVAHYLHPSGNASGPKSDGELVMQITLVDLLAKIGISVDKLGPGRYHEKQAAAALRTLGWTEGRASTGLRPRVWKRPLGSAERQPQQPAGDAPAGHHGGADAAPF